MSIRSGLGVLLAALVGALLANRVAPGAHVVVGLALVLCLAAVARACGLTAAELGLARRSWRAGLRWGSAVSGVVVCAYAIALLIAPVREAVSPAAEPGWGATIAAALFVIPVGTVIPEEFAFRGVLWALLRRAHGQRVATGVSSALFGLWHVLPALGGGAANEAVAGAVGAGPAATLGRVVGTVLVTFVAGMILCWLRVRSRSLLAPVLLHWAVNGLGAVVVKVA